MRKLSAVVPTLSLIVFYGLLSGTIITTTLFSVSIIEMICLLLLFSFLKRYQYGVTVTFCTSIISSVIAGGLPEGTPLCVRRSVVHVFCWRRHLQRMIINEGQLQSCLLDLLFFLENFDFAMQKTREKLVSLLRTFKHHEFPVESRLIIVG